MIPDLDLARVRKWITRLNSDMPPSLKEQHRYEIELSDRAITVVERRVPWHEDVDPDWSRVMVCRFRYTKVRREWSLYWPDRNSKFHHYDLSEPTAHIDHLIEHVKRDETGIFWG